MPTVDWMIAERIRRPIPAGMSVLPGSLPLVSFGDPDRALVATLSLNPSWLEFQSRSGDWLRGRQRRLASLVSLGAEDPRELDDEKVAQVVAESNAYFRGPRWNRGWFRWLESLLRASELGSYLDGSACHLDLVQWATKPAKSELAQGIWDRLVQADREFLRWQLSNSNVQVVLLDGASVVGSVHQAGLVADFDEEAIPYLAKNGKGRIRVFRAVADGVCFLGWNKSLARALSADGRDRLSRWLAESLQVPDSRPQRSNKPRMSSEEGMAAPIDLVNGFVPVGTEVLGVASLERLLRWWAEASRQPTVGDIGTFGGSRVVTVNMVDDAFVLNRDTKRAAVITFLAEATRAGGASHLRWHATWNAKGVINRVSYRADDEPTPGWYAYLSPPHVLPGPRELR